MRGLEIKEMTKEIDIYYFAVLREERSVSSERLSTTAATPKELYESLQQEHGFSLPYSRLSVAVNDRFQPWDTPLKTQDRVVFIPPVAGG